jgi:hypothetical protein
MAKVTSEMCKAIEAGIKSIAAIAEEAGVTKQAVVQMMKKYAGAQPPQVAPMPTAKAKKPIPKKVE